MPAKKKNAKAVKKTAKAAPAAKKSAGVIATIVEALQQSPKSREQLLAILVKRFPDRKSEGMNATIGVQMGRLGASKEKDNTDGTITYSLKK